jgi:hypothetical protein
MKRPIDVVGDTAFVPLTKGYKAIIDADDVELVGRHNWYAVIDFRRDGSVRNIYAMTNIAAGRGKQKGILLHRLIMGNPDGLQIDHIDHNGLNCQKSNLRKATSSQNNHNARKRIDNTSGVKGVYFHKPSKKWRAAIYVGGKPQYLGLFANLEDAKMAYAKASKIIHGKYGKLG